MPTYQYFCPKCQVSFSKIYTLAEYQERPKCGDCNSDTRRDYSAPTIKFNGSGFYSTDNYEL